MKLKGQRVSSDILKELSDILLTEVKDEDLKHVTITHVDTTNDLSYCRIYFTTLDDKNRDKIIKDINNASGFFKLMLSQRLDVRSMPDLKFIYDESIEYGKKIEKIIEEIKNN